VFRVIGGSRFYTEVEAVAGVFPFDGGVTVALGTWTATTASS
jgi:hypothetical protein